MATNKSIEHSDNTLDDYPHGASITSTLALFRFGQGIYLYLSFALALLFGGSFLLMASAKILGHIVESVTRQQESGTSLLLLSISFLALETAYIGCQYWGRIQLAAVTTKVAYGIRKQLFSRIDQLPMTYFDRQPLGRTITRLTADVEGIEAFFNGTLPKTISSLIQMFSVFVAMILSEPRFGLLVTFICLPSLFLSYFMRSLVKLAYRALKRFNAALNSKLAENINGMPIIRAFNLQKWSMELYQATNEQLFKSNIRLMTFNSWTQPILVFLCTIPTVGIIYWGGLKVLDGTLTVALFVAFVRYSERLLWPIRTISHEIQVLQEALASSERVRHMLEEPTEQQILGPSGSHREMVRGAIEFRNVSMSYEKDLPVLHNISFAVAQGMSVGLVGATGSGKTSTLSLIPGLYPIDSGEIIIDGTNLQNWDRHYLRQQVGMVSQDVEIFRGTLHDNLTIACAPGKKIHSQEILQACERSGLIHLVNKLPNGIDSLVLDGGKNFSMGERQLIAFTRMLLRNPSILILDEATANIDPRSEELIQQATQEVLKNRTCFIIAHRLNTVRNCDLILVFNNGRIVQQGSHLQLMAQTDQYYHQLASHQIFE